MPSGSEQIKNIVLVGRTGNGKSATGNSLVRSEAFVSETQATGVTVKCQTFRAPTERGWIINVIDTPGLFDLKVSAEFISKEIVRCLELADEGLHAVVLVISMRNRISKEEEDTLCKLQVLFGGKILDYLIVLFTGGDEFESNKENPETSQRDEKKLEKTSEQVLEHYFSKGCPEFLTRVLRLCGNRKVVFNNRTTNEIQKKKQVQQLLDNVEAIEKVNGGRPFKGELHRNVEAELSRHLDKQSELAVLHLARTEMANMKQHLELIHQNNLLQIAKSVEERIRATLKSESHERIMNALNDVRNQMQQNNRSCNIL